MLSLEREDACMIPTLIRADSLIQSVSSGCLDGLSLSGRRPNALIGRFVMRRLKTIKYSDGESHPRCCCLVLLDANRNVSAGTKGVDRFTRHEVV